MNLTQSQYYTLKRIGLEITNQNLIAINSGINIPLKQVEEIEIIPVKAWSIKEPFFKKIRRWLKDNSSNYSLTNLIMNSFDGTRSNNYWEIVIQLRNSRTESFYQKNIDLITSAKELKIVNSRFENKN